MSMKLHLFHRLAPSLLTALLVVGCQSTPEPEPEPAPLPDPTPSVPLGQLPETAPEPPPPDVALGGEDAQSKDYTPAQMQATVRNFADHYRQSMASALDRIIVESDDPELIRRAHTAKINGVTAMYDIAVDPIPASAMLNGLVLVSLQAKFLRAHGEEYLGEYYPLLQITADRLQEEAFRIAARAMTEQQRIDLRATIDQWAQANPDVRDIWYVRLDDLPGIREDPDVFKTFTNLPRNFLNVFNPFAGTGKSVTEAQVLAERMSWLTPRLMILAQWRAEAIVYNSIANTRISEALDLGERITAVAEELPDNISEQREALFNDLEENEETLQALLQQTNRLTENANALLTTADQITGRVENIQSTALANKTPRDPNAPPSRPFDITEYTEALAKLNKVVTDANTLLLNADTAASPEAIDDRLAVVESSVRNLIFTAAAALLIVGLLLILAVKFIPRRRPSRH
ncbi:MAG: hypothetical protein AAGA25_08540 [Planctomycetota bacterium]